MKNTRPGPYLFAGEIRLRRFAAVIGALILGFAQHAMALPVGFASSCSVSGSASAQDGKADLPPIYNTQTLSAGCGSQVSANGQVVANVFTDGGLSQFRFDQTANTSANAKASLGSLGVLAKSDSTSTPQAYLYQSGGVGGITENRFLAAANSLASTYWYDTFTLGGVTSPNGFVILRFSMDLHGLTSASALGAHATLLSRLLLDDGNRYFGDAILSLSDSGTLSTTIGFHSFSQFSLMGLLEAQSDSQSGWLGNAGYTSASNAAADAFNTSDFHIDVVTPGGTYSSLSGQSYLTPLVDPGTIPEPGTAWLLSSAFIALIGFGTRRNR